MLAVITVTTFATTAGPTPSRSLMLFAAIVVTTYAAINTVRPGACQRF